MLKELLETRHLNQIVRVNTAALENFLTKLPHSSLTQKFPGALLSSFPTRAESIMNCEWVTVDDEPQAQINYTPAPSNATPTYTIRFFIPTILTICRSCKVERPMNLVSAYNRRLTLGKQDEPYSQIFLFFFQCQACRSLPETFLIRREGLKLILSGRSPMEKVYVEKYLPKDQTKYFSDAIVAFNSGQVLPAKFMLRTFIEQYVRSLSKTPETDKIDDLFDEYNAGLDEDLKRRAPSLRYIYEQLSTHLHAADETADLFTSAKEDIEKHFDAKRLFNSLSKK